MTAPAPSVFAAPEAGFLYDGQVMHQRMRPFSHRFAYRVWSALLDIDRLDEALRPVRIMSRNRFNLVSFHDKDHGPSDGTSLRAHVDGLLAEAGVARPARVFLLCYPRVLGYAFNPISVYYAYGAGGALTALIYEVRNTFGEMHTYVAPVAPGEATPAGVRQERDKLFFVSPFLGFGLTYRFRLNDPADKLALRILEVDAEGHPVLAASFTGTRKPLTSAALLAASAAAPLLGMKVMAGIHWEALKLWIKGARLFPRPAPPPPASLANPARFLHPKQGDGAYHHVTKPSVSKAA
jgi:DUF1365 family protein